MAKRSERKPCSKRSKSSFTNERTNKHKARQVNIEEEAKVEDKSDTEDNGKDVLEQFGDKDRPTM
eukprot:5625466-Heterocapsa_arctica.AAC.1